MVKLLKTSVVLAMSTWLFFLSGCEKQAEKKALKTTPVIVSGRISPPSALKSEKKPSLSSEIKSREIKSREIKSREIQSPEKIAKVSTNPSKSSLKASEGKKGLNPPGAVTEEAAKREQIVAVDGNASVKEMIIGYDPKGRVDPFIPLLQEKEVVTPDIDDKPKRMLTPLEKLSLNQIKLVAVILMENRQLAMVEDATGKGYEVMIGTYMGKNSGQVSKINQSSLVVTEYVKDYKGIRQTKFHEIKLHKNESGE